MKKFLILFLILTLLLCGCKEKTQKITEKEAIQIVLEAVDAPQESLGGIHVHAGAVGGEDCYLIFVTVDGTTKQYVVAQDDGQILSVSDSDHSH